MCCESGGFGFYFWSYDMYRQTYLGLINDATICSSLLRTIKAQSTYSTKAERYLSHHRVDRLQIFETTALLR